MDQLKRIYLKLNPCFLAGIIIGILIGAATLIIIVSYRMDLYCKKIAYLEHAIQDKNAVLEKFEKNINTRSLVIKAIEVVLVFNGDEIDKINIEKSIKEKYSLLLGKEVKKIDPDIIVEVIDKRILKIRDKEYKLKVNKLILTEVLKIWISAELIK